MYSESGGGGLLIATVTSAPEYNLLPSSAEIEAANSKYEVILANYYENDDAEAIYGVTGAGPAFTFDGNNFSLINPSKVCR